MLLTVLACAMLIKMNWKKAGFFSANAVDIVTIFIGVFIAFYLTEQMNDRRRRAECIEHVIMEIEAFIADDDNYKVNPTALMRQQSCANRIKYIKDAEFPDIKEDIVFIEQHFDEIRDLYSNHNNVQEIDHVKKDIDRHRTLINDKCCKIRINLYSEYELSE